MNGVETDGAAIPEVSFLDILNLLLRRWRFILGFGFTVAVLVAIVSLVLPVKYLARTSFIQAESGRTQGLPGNLGSLAARFGVTGLSGGPNTSLEFLQSAIVSRDVLDTVILNPLQVDSTRYGKPSGGVHAFDLIQWFKVHDRTPAKKLDHVRRIIRKRMTVGGDTRSGIVVVTFTARDPFVAAAFLRRLLSVLNSFNLHTRQTSTSANRAFLESRVDDARTQLGTAEGRLRQFYEQNRSRSDAPSLTFEEARRKRGVDLAQQIYVTLASDLEQARIDEVKDTPVITVVETAQPAVWRTAPKRKRMTLLGGIAGVLLGSLIVAARTFFRRAELTPTPEWEEFRGRLAALPGATSLARRLDAIDRPHHIGPGA